MGLTQLPQVGIPAALTAGSGWGESVTTSSSLPVFVAPFACTVEWAALESHDSSVTASDVNFWTISVRRHRAGVTTTIISKTTQVTGGQAITTRVGWIFTGTYDVTNKILQAGDVVDFAFIPTGAPGAITKIMLQIRYVPT